MQLESATLAERLRALSYKELQAKLSELSAAVHAHDQRHTDLARDLEKTLLAVRQREQQLILDSAPTHSDPILRELRDAEAAARQRLRTLPEQERQLKAVLNVLQDEVRRRDAELDRQVNSACMAKWRDSSPDQFINASRRVIAEAMLAHCRHHTHDPAFASAEDFINGFIHPAEVQRVFREMVDNERAEAKAQIIQQDERFG